MNFSANKAIAVCAAWLVCWQSLPADMHKLTVSGSSTVFKPADKLSLTLGVMTFEKEVKNAILGNSEKMAAVIKALSNAGLEETEMQTGNFTVNPKYTPAALHPPADWQPSIAGYEVTNTVDIHTLKLDHLEGIIDAAGKSGANLIQSLSFSLQDDKLAKAEAIALAIQQARSYAKAAAREAGLKLVGILELSVNSPFLNARTLNAERFAYAKEVSTPIISGEVEISGSVSMVYSIQPE